jgi:hypothetical protein
VRVIKIGLDMYLTAKLRTYKAYNKEKEHMLRPIIRKALPEIWKSGNIEYIEVSFEAGYWRKANHIHSWFVNNVQEGADDCREYNVSREKLMELKKICAQVMEIVTHLKQKTIKVHSGWSNGKKTYANVKVYVVPESVKTMLPTKDGFFFGGMEYDEYYVKDLKDTIMIIDKCLALPEDWDFTYDSSW